MATVSSHILDSAGGKHAAGIRCQLFCLAPTKRLLFDIDADDEGRFAETVDIDETESGAEFELVIHGADYFAARGLAAEAIVKTVVIRFCMEDGGKRYHLPVMLSPHSCSCWWSG